MAAAPDLYLALKFLHVIGASVLFGTGLGIAYFLFRAERKEEPAALAATLRTVVIADYVFTATAAIAQPLTGFALVHLGGYDLSQTWLWASLALYVLIGACWLPVVYLQIRMRGLAEAAVAAGRPGAAGALSPPVAPLVLARLARLPVDTRDLLADDRQARLMQAKKEPGLAFAGGSRALSGSKCEQPRYCELSSRSLFSPTIICCSSSV